MCNAVLIGTIFAIGLRVGMGDRLWFWIAFAFAIFFNSEWWKRIEDSWRED